MIKGCVNSNRIASTIVYMFWHSYYADLYNFTKFEYPIFICLNYIKIRIKDKIVKKTDWLLNYNCIKIVFYTNEFSPVRLLDLYTIDPNLCLDAFNSPWQIKHKAP